MVSFLIFHTEVKTRFFFVQKWTFFKESIDFDSYKHDYLDKTKCFYSSVCLLLKQLFRALFFFNKIQICTTLFSLCA